ncbi:SPOR domain-containing protein [Azotobacter chroococcum]|uniref:Cell division protein FtsN n=1 Tax=Azotobacter chroococcum TaxID=353 RepID=A0A4R1PL50_9GAMM|nr:SPOR domain-containing protein [Azotobacter chroococcum]TBW00214.1 SPOR domain-containing protein [Azotobacter chroococcum]TCL31911.1 cell division protein FtsN [Azotobacter chroococcum]
MAKNTAPKRGASRTPPPHRREIPSWLWLACGLAVGGFAMFLTKLEPGSDAIKRDTAEQSPSKAAPQQPNKPKYDFYTLLPESEVVVPPTAQQQPPQAQPQRPPEQPPAQSVPQLPPAQQQAQPPQQTQQQQQQQQQLPPAQPTQPAAQQQAAQAKPPAQRPAQQAQQPKLTPAQDAARAEALLNGRTPPAVTAKPPALAKPAPATHYYLQAGSFRSKADADDARARIALLGQSVRVEVGTVRGETWHRVVAGPFTNRQQLEQAQKQLAGDGFRNLLPQQRQTR